MHSSLSRTGAVLALVAILLPQTLLAQAAGSTTPAAAGQAILLLRPHCENSTKPLDTDPVPSFSDFLQSGSGSCANFSTRDPQTQQTQTLHVGDTLDLDLVVYNPGKSPLNKVRSWISYDPQTLQGVSVELKDLPVATPGEADFAAAEGFLKLSATADTTKPALWLVTVAHIKFKILRAPRAGLTPIGFYDVQADKTGHTYVLTDQERGIVQTNLGSLLVFVDAATTSSAPTNAVGSSSKAFSSGPVAEPPVFPGPPAEVSNSSSSEGRTTFVLLQVQNLRATTKGGTIFAAWEKLPSAQVVGYNLYYGTERGRYIQRKSITGETNADTIRGLPENTVYYLAVRAFNDKNEESAFSREVMLKTGDPRSSTAPLSMDGEAPAGNPLTGSVTGTVPGEAGVPTLAIIVLTLCALTGTALAFRRQFAATKNTQTF
jgi:hypothetical protein